MRGRGAGAIGAALAAALVTAAPAPASNSPATFRVGAGGVSDPDFGVNRYRVSAAPCDQVGQSFGIVVLVRQGRIEVDIGMYILHLYLQHAENFSQAFHVLVLLCLCASVWAPHRSSIVLSV